MQGVLFFFLLLAASFVDLKRREIPDWVSGSIAALTLLHFRPEYLPGLIPALFFLAAAVRGGLGGGDVKLAAACGLVLGLPAALMGTILGLLLQLLFHLGALCVLPLFKRQVWSTYPMAPFLAIGYAVAYYV
ncbi:A24 family peptidase [Enterocloster bolteae]|uniref:prepilin peptidase n=1 Tax=Enterocloster bolteae TaxID=208479 RepID=UPI0022E0D3AD|nr:A24 family peptidase [Enterocloster bolteae]